MALIWLISYRCGRKSAGKVNLRLIITKDKTERKATVGSSVNLRLPTMVILNQKMFVRGQEKMDVIDLIFDRFKASRRQSGSLVIRAMIRIKKLWGEWHRNLQQEAFQKHKRLLG